MYAPTGAIVLISGIAVWSRCGIFLFSGNFVFYGITYYRERVCPSLYPFFTNLPFFIPPSEKKIAS